MSQKIKSYLEPIHAHSYVKDDQALPEITGLFFVIPEPGLPSRLCYELTYSDGKIDYVPFIDVETGNYKIKSQDTK